MLTKHYLAFVKCSSINKQQHRHSVPPLKLICQLLRFLPHTKFALVLCATSSPVLRLDKICFLQGQNGRYPIIALWIGMIRYHNITLQCTAVILFISWLHFVYRTVHVTSTDWWFTLYIWSDIATIVKYILPTASSWRLYKIKQARVTSIIDVVRTVISFYRLEMVSAPIDWLSYPESPVSGNKTKAECVAHNYTV